LEENTMRQNLSLSAFVLVFLGAAASAQNGNAEETAA
jgi:hypothetical protein